MSGDYSRDSFDALRNFAGVYLQQGRAVLDSDWNEMVALFERRIRAATVDTIGRAVVPRETPHAFEVQVASEGFAFGRGRLYVDGLLAEHFGTADFDGSDSSRPAPTFDRARPGDDGPEGVLDEMISPEAGDFTDYLNQPYWPTPDPLPDGDGPHMAYLVVWERAVTATEAPELLEPALDGLDTTTRLQTVWQVRVLPNVGAGATCATPDEDLVGWIDVIAPSTARLSTGTTDVEEPEDPCLVPPTEGYTGLENQFYRVEIHGLTDPENPPESPVQADWGFKFSRENASVRAPVSAIGEDGDSVTVTRIGRDRVLHFQPGDWVELTDDNREFNHRSGQMLRVDDVDEETREIAFDRSIDSDLMPPGGEDTVTTRHTRLIRWDQKGVIRLDDESATVWADLDADGSDGLIPVPPDDRAIVLESGITVRFSTAAGSGRYREMDHWRFAARTAGTQIEILRSAPPDGVQRHHARLAVGGGGNNEPLDCRTFWPPHFEAGEGCACTVCVTAESHNSGSLTIQQAIEQIGSSGGTVCLEGGLYTLGQPVQIAGRNAVKIIGQGLGTVIAYQGSGGAIQVQNAVDVSLERFTILATPTPATNTAPPPVHGIAAVNTALLAVRRVAVVVASPNPEDRADFGIALDGVQIGAKIEECVSVAAHAIGSRSTYGLDEDGDLQFAAFAELHVEDCILFAGRRAILFDRVAINIAGAHFARNLVLSLRIGLQINWAEIPAASLAVEASTVVANQTAAILSAGRLRVQDCQITGGGESDDGIVLAPNLLPQAQWDAQIVGNVIYDLAGAGIRITGQLDTAFIKRNIIRDAGMAGIAMEPDASVRHIAVDNNRIERIGLTSGVDAVGVRLTQAVSGQVIDNAISDVGAAGGNGQTHAGIAMQGGGSFDISGNTLTGIGGTQQESSAVGILAMQPFTQLSINANRIAGGEVSTDAQLDWVALRIGPVTLDANTPPGTGTTGFESALPGIQPQALAFFMAGEATWAASENGLFAATAIAPAQIVCRGNEARTAQRTTRAVLSVVDSAASGVAVSDNLCDLQGGGGVPQVVLLAAPRVSVSGNIITHNVDANSIWIMTGTGSNGTKGAAAPVGNIVSNSIMVNGAPLKPPFETLNPRA